MSSTLRTVRENIQAQGLCGLDDKTCVQVPMECGLSRKGRLNFLYSKGGPVIERIRGERSAQ